VVSCIFYYLIDVAGLAYHIIYKEHNPRFKTKGQRRKFLDNLAKELCMHLIEARSINQVVMRNHFLQGTVNIVLERRIVSPQEAAAPSTVQRGSRRSTPIWKLLFFQRPNRKKQKTRKSCADCIQPVSNEQSVRQCPLFVKITESSKEK